MKHLEVAGAILVYENKVLCAQRGKGKYDYISYKYEFPGGKLEMGESPREALHRELIEEMDIDIDINAMKTYMSVEHRYEDFEIRMHTFVCHMEHNDVNLKEHINALWLEVDKMKDLDWAEADLPIVKELEERGF